MTPLPNTRRSEDFLSMMTLRILKSWSASLKVEHYLMKLVFRKTAESFPITKINDLKISKCRLETSKKRKFFPILKTSMTMLDFFLVCFAVHTRICWYLYTISKNDVISSVLKHYCALES